MKIKKIYRDWMHKQYNNVFVKSGNSVFDDFAKDVGLKLKNRQYLNSIHTISGVTIVGSCFLIIYHPFFILPILLGLPIAFFLPFAISMFDKKKLNETKCPICQNYLIAKKKYGIWKIHCTSCNLTASTYYSNVITEDG